MWAIAERVNTDRDHTTMVVADSAGPGKASGPAPVPGSAAPAAEETVGATPLGVLVPLGVQHVGQRVRTSGQALTAPGNGGFWLRSDGNAVIWVKSRQPVKPGEQVQDLAGVLRASGPGQAEERLKGNDVQRLAGGMSGSQLATEVYLDTTTPDSSVVGSSRARPGATGEASRRSAAPG